MHAGLGFRDAMRKIAAANPAEVIYTNTHPAIEKNMIYELRRVTSILRTAHYFADAIRHIELGIPVEEAYSTEGILDTAKISRFAVKPYRRSEHIHQAAESR